MFNFPERHETPIEKIKSWWDYTKTYRIEIPYRTFIQGVRNLIKWAKIVWHDSNWDYQSTIKVLRFKIQDTAKGIEKRGRHYDYQRDLKYMHLAIRLIDKIWPDMYSDVKSYDSEYTEYHVTEHNFIPIEDEDDEELRPELKGGYRMESNEISERFDEYFAENKLMYKKAITYLKTERGYADPESKMTRAMVISRLKHEKAKRLLFRIIAEHIEEWWD